MELILLFAFMIVMVVAYKGWRIAEIRKWLYALTVAILLGIADAGYFSYMANRKNCGTLYSPDIGCAAEVPGWMVVVGLALAFSAGVICLIIIARVLHHNRTTKSAK